MGNQYFGCWSNLESYAVMMSVSCDVKQHSSGISAEANEAAEPLPESINIASESRSTGPTKQSFAKTE